MRVATAEGIGYIRLLGANAEIFHSILNDRVGGLGGVDAFVEAHDESCDG